MADQGREEPNDNGAGKTEWEDALIRHGVLSAPEKLPTEDEIQLKEIDKLQTKDALESKTLKQLETLEDELEEDVLSKYRKKRLAELKEKAKREKYGEVVQIRASEFVREVSEAGDVWVVLHLFSAERQTCRLLQSCLDTLAKKFKAVKFLKIIYNECIPKYPEKNTPTVLLYYQNDKKAQLVGAEEWGDLRMTPDSVEWVLSKNQVLKTELEENPLQKQPTMTTIRKGFVAPRKSADSDGED